MCDIEDIETITCERCSKPFPVDKGEQCTTDTGPWCDACAADWRAHFASCDHTWEPHDGDWGPGQYCTKCSGFVEDEDFASLFPLAATQAREAAAKLRGMK